MASFVVVVVGFGVGFFGRGEGGCYVLFENFVLWKTCNVNVL